MNPVYQRNEKILKEIEENEKRRQLERTEGGTMNPFRIEEVSP